MVRTLLPRAAGYSSISYNHEQEEATLAPSEIIFVTFITPFFTFLECKIRMAPTTTRRAPRIFHWEGGGDLETIQGEHKFFP